MPAVPFAINSGAKFMIFRPFESLKLWDKVEGQMDVDKHIDKGFYYKFNCANEIKLVKNFLEDNGFIPQPFYQKQMSTTF